MIANGELQVFSAGDHPDRDTFHRDFVGGSRPALFRTGQAASLGAWSPAALAARFSDREVAVRESQNAQFAIDPATGEPPPITVMPFGALVEAIRERKRHLYLMQQPVAQVFPELLGELPLPAYVRRDELHSLNLWIGPAGNVTRLHWDNYHNILVQLSGRKRVLLMPPSEKGLSLAADQPTQALHQADLAGPIRVRDESSGGIRCVLEPGDFLFMPAFWWHEIESIDESVSLNAWWKVSFEECFVESALSALQRTPAYPDSIRFYLQTVHWQKSLWEAAELARQRGIDWLHVRLLAAAVEADRR